MKRSRDSSPAATSKDGSLNSAQGETKKQCQVDTGLNTHQSTDQPGTTSGSSGSSIEREDKDKMATACPHLSAAFATLAPPRPSQQVHRDECTQCFDDQDGLEGIDVCLTCFNGGCVGNEDRNHAALHHSKTGHNLVVNVKRVPKPKPMASEQDDVPSKPKKLAIAAETEADRYDFITTPKCLACQDKELPRTDKLEEVIGGVMKALSSSQQSDVKAWEEEIVPCDHTRELKQLGEATKLELSELAKCRKCDLNNNLWLCLTCGNLGCGRAQFGGVGGNSHGLTHFEETGHPVSVKQGTITAEGTADIYCYACNDARIDPELAKHLKHFGMNVMDLSKTEKSMTELQLEQNLNFDFNMTGDDGKELEPVFGPGLTGIRNLGNSCYMASVLQALFSLPSFQSRYQDAYRPHVLACTNTLPSSCFECQMTKVADGLLSGRYSKPRKTPPGNTDGDEKQPLFQEGVRPTMFKALVGKGHEEFSTMRQQDADEFLKHLLSFIQRENRKVESINTTAGAPTSDATRPFGFALQQRLQCTECKKVRYSIEPQDAGLSLPVPLRIKKASGSAENDANVGNAKQKAPAEGIHADVETKPVASDKVEYEDVDLRECLDLFTAPEALEYHCPSCNKKVIATKQTLFNTFPDVLAVQVRRFQLVNWVPQKVPVPVIVPVIGPDFELDRYLGTGKREDEEELPDTGADATPSESSEITFDVGAMSQLTAMGFPEVRCQRALLATGNTGDAEAAMNWLFAHMEDPDIDDPIDFTQVKAGGAGSESGPGQAQAAGADTSMLEEMGFTKAQAKKALRLNSNNPEIAVAWLFENGDDQGDTEEAAAAAAAAAEGTSEVGSSSAEAPKPVIAGSANLPARYRLKAFISHKGPSVHSGHYVAHVRRPGLESQEEGDDEGWVFFNDEKVVKAPLTSASVSDPQSDVGVRGLSKLAYEYIFERR